MEATYTKLRDGNWGIRVAGRNVSLIPGSIVEVRKKSGDKKDEVVEKVLYKDVAQGVTLCSIQQSAHKSNGCSCESTCCKPRCQCDRSCNCRGGNIYDC